MEYPSDWLFSGWSCLCRRRCGSACPRVAGLVGLHLLPTPSVRSAADLLTYILAHLQPLAGPHYRMGGRSAQGRR